MLSAHIGFIGGGNMATALIEGLQQHPANGRHIVVADPNAARREALSRQYGVVVTEENHQAATGAEVIVLAVKPAAVPAVAHALSQQLTPDQLVVSVAAGITVDALQRWLGGHAAVVRAMPNTPAMVGCGATGLFAPADLSAAHRDMAESLMRSVGLVQWVADEALMDVVTALSGSGPAYVFLVMEAMQSAAEQLGLPAETARLLTLETVYGAARLAMTAAEPPSVLRARVTSPNGTTERGIAALETAGLRQAFASALTAAHARSVELGAALATAPTEGRS
ncbi:pyrroline-5-carboxylate reductase [Halothiobacillus sp. DCM-1]|uniref:pyrroline-5-carboxylate reductase n=1 Tax=Halothiobacillus sp. DCM-1 TaxID=3112558 RepID=UPI0032562F64